MNVTTDIDDDFTTVSHYLLDLNGDELDILGRILGLSNATVTEYQHCSLMKFRDSIVKAWLLKKVKGEASMKHRGTQW